MKGNKIRQFMRLAGQEISENFRDGSEQERALGAQLLLSETLEYVIKGLGVIPKFDGTPITNPNALEYEVANPDSLDRLEMLDGLADVAYTMYWNANAFGIPLEQGFDLVCDNNLEKFVRLDAWTEGARALKSEEWNCGCKVEWPEEVVHVEVLKVDDDWYAVGKDQHGKVRKPSSYAPVDLTPLLQGAA